MTRRAAVFQVLLAVAALPGASSANMEESPAQCLLRLLDDRGRNVSESVAICRADQPENSHMIVHLITDDPELRSGSPILLRRGDVVVPPEVLRHHLLSLGLPSTSDGQGQVGLIALAPGPYDVYHGKGTSYRNLLDKVEIAKLASVTLGINATVEIAVTLDFRLDKRDAGLAFPVDH